MDEQYTYTHWHPSHTQYEAAPLSHNWPQLSAPICVYMSNPDTYNIPYLYQKIKLCIKRAPCCIHIKDLQIEI